jgi:formylglycine-generating enzyme required for sulfatase activity
MVSCPPKPTLRLARSLAAVFACWLVLAAFAPPSLGSDQASLVSLVVANSKYANADDDSLVPLDEASKDGEKIANRLREFGFEPERVADFSIADIARFENAWTSFLDRSKALGSKSEKKGLSVFYYSGHGVEIGSESYFVPVDMRRSDPEASYQQNGVSLQKLLGQFHVVQEDLRKAGKTLHGVFIIDACRKAAKYDKEKGNGFGLPPLAPAEAYPGILVLYAASRGQAAQTSLSAPQKSLDKPGAAKPAAPGEPCRVEEGVSVFTSFLLEELSGNAPLHDVAARVQEKVFTCVQKAARGSEQQFPALDNQLSERITIKGRPPEAPPPERGEDPPDEIALDLARNPLPSMAAATAAPASRKWEVVSYFRERLIVWECRDCPPVVVLRRGEFVMGSPQSEPGRGDHEQQRQIKLERPFAIGESEVTRKQFRAFLDARCKKTPSTCGTSLSDYREPGDEKPVAGVTWFEAREYADWLNEVVPGPHGRYRLPTEAEWEYAARAGARNRFVADVTEHDLCAYGNGADASLRSLFGANNSCNDGKAIGVANARSYKPNAFGLYGVHGNVWEWVRDCWTDDNGSRADDGSMFGSDADTACRRVVRGGSWRSGWKALRFAMRLSFAPDHRRPTIGFRVLREITGDELERTTAQLRRAPDEAEGRPQ